MRLHMRFFHETLFCSYVDSSFVRWFASGFMHYESYPAMPSSRTGDISNKKNTYICSWNTFIVVLLCKSINSFVYYCTSSCQRYFDSPRAKHACAKRRLTTDMQWRRVCHRLTILPAVNLSLNRHRSPCS